MDAPAAASDQSMTSLVSLVPVFFMLVLGFLARHFSWISANQKEGALKTVFTIFFPLMVFNLLSSTALQADLIDLVIFLLACYTLFYLLAKTLLKKFLAPYSAIGAFLLTTAEGGNMSLPLFLSIIGSSSTHAGDPILLDLAGIFFCFLIIPVLVSLDLHQAAPKKTLLVSTLRSPMILASLFGLAFNLSGLYGRLAGSSWMPIYTSCMNMVTASIIPIVLFSLGYDFRIRRGILGPALRLLVVRLALFALILLGLYFLFPARMHDPAFACAAILYFMAPTGFGVLGQIDPLLDDADKKEYCSIVIDLNMIVTMTVYIICVLCFSSSF